MCFEMIKVSVITVVYNGVNTLEQTILSVLNQNYPNLEYIIIDGNSTDGTQDVIKKYESKISYWISEPDGGIYDAMNKGIQRATGEIIGIINSDDWYEMDALKKITKIYKETNADMIFGEIKRISADGESLGYTIDSVIPMHPAMFVKRSIYQLYGGFVTKYQISSDHEFKLRLISKRVSIAHTNDIIANFRVTGISNTDMRKRLQETYEIELNYLERGLDVLPTKQVINEKYRKEMFLYCLRENSAEICDILRNGIVAFEKGILIWGTGVWGRKLLPIFANAGVPLWFTDNNKEKWGETVENIPVVSTEACKTFDGTIIVAVLNSQKEISEQIRKEFRSDAKIITLDEIQEEVLRENL